MVNNTSATLRAAPRTAKRAIATHVSAEAVSRRAYQLFEARGHEPGHDVEDWLVAEAELLEGNNAAVTSPEARRRDS